MPEYKLSISAPRPYFAEIPYALWGEVNYDSDGNCQRPTDREWTHLEVMQRGTREHLVITGTGKEFSVQSKNRSLAATSRYPSSCSFAKFRARRKPFSLRYSARYRTPGTGLNCATTSSASASCGTRSGRTKDVTSMLLIPLWLRASISATF